MGVSARVVSVSGIFVILGIAAAAQAQSWSPPSDAERCPSKWGAGDQRGAANRLTPQKVLEAAKLIHSGKVYHIGQVYEAGMPLVGNRHFKLTIPGLPTGYPPRGKNQSVGNDEMFSGEMGQESRPAQ